MRLKDKIAIVTGGARGIGYAIAKLFSEEGATVIIWDVLEDGHSAAEKIREAGGKAQFHKVDVTSMEEVQAKSQAIHDEFGKIDILINNAGITRDRTLHKMSPEEWQQVLDVNLTGVFNCTQTVSKYMRQAGYGKIVSAASNVALRGNFGQTNYAATKAGIVAMTKTWALELGKYGINVNCIAPGFTETDMTNKIPAHQVEYLQTQIPLQRIAKPIEIAYGYLFLSSDESSFVHGICLTIDGGVSR
ncbi:MAG: beta-ketoacyl-ACP reductase [Bacteroidia bacterium]|nr:beta-ketoacyl-ACP reductase [Bacteroidia bacterium]